MLIAFMLPDLIFAERNMRLRDNYKWVSALMLISELLIIAFSAYWLYGQYIKEKNGLEKELLLIYKQSYNSVLDSLIIDYIIEPAIRDSSSMARYQFNGSNEIIAGNLAVNDSSGKMAYPDSVTTNRTVEIQLRTTDSTGVFQRQGLNDSPGNSEEMLIRGVKAFVMFSSDSGMLHSNYLKRASGGQDSVIFVENYIEKLSENNFNLIPGWISSDRFDKDSLIKRGRIVIGDFSSTVPAAVFSRNTIFIIKRIIPQILFALILVILTGMAFFLALRNIKKQQRLNEIRNNFISNISHELKTPVSTVKIAIEALKKYDTSKGNKETKAEYLEMAGKEIKRLELLISKVLDHSIIEEDGSILNFEEVDLAGLIDDSIRSLQPMIKAKGARVSFKHPEKIIVSCDPVYLQGVIINLFDNSLKYGNGDPEIAVDLSTNGDYAVLKGSDKGPGIPEEYIGRVFDKFFRVPHRDLHNVKGYGLGLSFVCLIVKMHNGSIGVKNNVDGCTFTIKIPMRQE